MDNIIENNDSFPLNDVQMAYLFGRSSSLALGNINAHIYLEIEYDGLIDKNKLEKAINILIHKHEALRILIKQDATQTILPKVPYYQVQIYDEITRNIRNQIKKKFNNNFSWPFFEIGLSYLSKKTIIHFYFDLIIIDGNGLNIFFKELSELYFNNCLNDLLLLPVYKNIILTENKQDINFNKAKNYWVNRINLLPNAPDLPTKKLSKNLAANFKRFQAILPKKCWLNLKEKAKNINISSLSLLITIYAEIIKTWAKTPDFTLNLMFFNQSSNTAIGNFSTTLLLEVHLHMQQSWEEKAKTIHQQLANDLKYSAFNGIKVLNLKNKNDGGTRRAAMPIVFAYGINEKEEIQEINSILPAFEWYGQNVRYSHLETPHVLLDHQVFVDKAQNLHFFWDVRNEYFPEGMMNSMFQAYHQTLLSLATTDFLTKIPYSLTPKEELQFIQKVNNTFDSSIKSDYLHLPIFKQAQKNPQKIAILTNSHTLSYQQLIATTISLAEDLSSLQVKPNDCIAIIMHKGWEQIVATLAIHVSGAAYIAIDPKLPLERIKLIIKTSNCKGIITNNIKIYSNQLDFRIDANEQKEGLNIKYTTKDELICKYAENANANSVPYFLLNKIKNINNNRILPIPVPKQKTTDTAYIIFTSGTTGIPKGVMITHEAAFNTIAAINKLYSVNSNDRCLGLSSLSFDLSVYDIFGLLSAGGSIFLPTDNENTDPSAWAKIICRQEITIWNSVPALMQLLVDYMNLQPKFSYKLRLILLSGDWISMTLPHFIHKYFSAEIISLGGATEASIWSNYYHIKKINHNWMSIPYGKALPNQKLYIFDNHLQSRPMWAIGMIYIAGRGLAQGYLNDQTKTKKAFIWHHEKKEYLYKTNDLGRLMPDGNIEFLGRDDLQVKVQGYRIELEEIEAAIYSLPHVLQTLVRVIGEKEEAKKIVAFIRTENGIIPEQIKDYLRKKLPFYMIPNNFIPIIHFPLTSNGKIDTEALLANFKLTTKKIVHTPPKGPIEEKIAKIWQKLLKIDNIGRYDNFFALGGTSFFALQMIQQVKRKLNITLSFSALFNQGSIAELLAEPQVNTDPCLINLQPLGNQEAIFLFHPLGGGIFSYQELINYLSKEHPVYGIQSLNYLNDDMRFLTIEEMATSYANSISKLNLTTPIWLGGWSFGGLIAFATGLLLQKQKIDVKPILLFDTPAPVQKTPLSNEQILKWFKKDYANNNNKQLLNIFSNNIRASENYQFPLCHLDVILIKAQMIEMDQLRTHPYQQEQDWGWHYQNRGHIQNYSLNTRHEDLLKKPWVIELANIINKIITSKTKNETLPKKLFYKNFKQRNLKFKRV